MGPRGQTLTLEPPWDSVAREILQAADGITDQELVTPASAAVDDVEEVPATPPEVTQSQQQLRNLHGALHQCCSQLLRTYVDKLARPEVAAATAADPCHANRELGRFLLSLYYVLRLVQSRTE